MNEIRIVNYGIEALRQRGTITIKQSDTIAVQSLWTAEQAAVLVGLSEDTFGQIVNSYTWRSGLSLFQHTKLLITLELDRRKTGLSLEDYSKQVKKYGK